MEKKSRGDIRSGNIYIERINRVMDYIDGHLCDDLSLELLAGIAAFSRFHFHRIFSSFVGETLAGYIARQRLQKAAHALLTRPDASVTEIAGDCGFANSAVFAKNFRKHFGSTATAWRSKNRDLPETDAPTDRGSPGILPQVPEREHGDDARQAEIFIEYLQDRQRWSIVHRGTTRTVNILDIPDMTLAYVRYFGPYRGNAVLFEELFGKLLSRIGPRGLVSRDSTEAIVLYHEFPDITPDERLRISVCCTVPEGTHADGETGVMSFSPGTCAVARFHCAADEYGEAWDWMYKTWFPASGFVPADLPAFERYALDSYDRATGKTTVDVCVPVTLLDGTGKPVNSGGPANRL